MIEVRVFRANETKEIRKNGTFIEGKLYFGRHSKRGAGYVIRSEEGYWIPVYDKGLTVNRFWDWRRYLPNGFETVKIIYMVNHKRLNQFDSVKEYLEGENSEKWWYAFTHLDKELKAKGGYI